MDEFGQKFIVKYFHLKGWGNKTITAELEGTFQGSILFCSILFWSGLLCCVLSRAIVKRWLRKFKTGDLSCSDQHRPGRRLTILRPILKKFFEKHPFLSAKVITRHFDISPRPWKRSSVVNLNLKVHSEIDAT
jgi:hypothetical protein